MNVIIFVIIILLQYSFHQAFLITEKRLPLSVEQGKSAFLSQANIPVDPKLKSADLCQIEVDDIQPLSSAVGFVKPKKFPCYFKANSVIYQHEGSSLTLSDTIFLNIYFFRKQFSSVQNVTVFVIITPRNQPSRITLKSYLTVKSWKGISQALSTEVIQIRYNPSTEFCRIRHLNRAALSTRLYPWLVTRSWPMTGLLITFNKTKIYDFNLECQETLLMGLRFMHRKSGSSQIDFLPLVIEITRLDSDEIIHLTHLHIPIHISAKPFTGISDNLLPPPLIKAFRTITLTNSGGTLSLLPSDCLEISSQDKDRGPLIINILAIHGSYQAAFRNLRDASKIIWSFTFSDLINGLIAFQLRSYNDKKDLIFRVDLIIMDSYFIKSNILILKLVDVLENKDQPFQVYTTPFYTYTSSNRPLRDKNIQIVGDIDLDLVKYRIINQNITSGSLYKFPSIALVNQPTNSNAYFLTKDIKQDSVFFKHNGILLESELINVRVSIDKFRFVDIHLPIYIVRVYNRTKDTLLDSYTEYSVPKDGLFQININRILNKNFYFYVHYRDHMDVVFDIVMSPLYGTVLKLFPGQNISSNSNQYDIIRFQDLLDGLIYYRYTIDYKKNRDFIELKQNGRIGDKTVKLIFNIQHHAKNFLLSKMDTKIIFTVTENIQYKKLSYLNLNFGNYFLQPEDITYNVVSFPRYEYFNETIDAGRLVSLKSIQSDVLIGDTALTTKLTNFRSAHLTSVTSFTQRQILDNDIIFIPPSEDIGPSDRKVVLSYSVKDSEGYEIRNIPFFILIKAVNNRPPILIHHSIVVARDEETFLTRDNLIIKDEDTLIKYIFVEFVTLPVYGSLFDDQKKVLQNGYKFSAKKLNTKSIKYRHNGYNVNKDNFNIRLFDGVQTSQIFNIIINITKRVIPASNWNLYINNSIIVKENSTVILHQSVFHNVLKGFDFKQFSNPMFIIVAMPTRGNIYNEKVVVSTFYYNEVGKGQIAYQHTSTEIGFKSQFDFTQIWVLETGESFNLNFTIQPVNSQTPKFYSQVALQVNEGGSVIISYYSISFVDLDSIDEDISVQIITPPRWGIISFKDSLTPIKTFSIKDIKLGKIIYINSLSGNGSEQTNDIFTVRGTDGLFQSPALEIRIFIHSVNDEAPSLILKNFNVAVGEKRTLDDSLFQVSDADVPRDNIQISVTIFPKKGNLSLKYKYGEIQLITRNSPPLTLQLLKFANLIYIQNSSFIKAQNQVFPVKDQFELTVTDSKYTVKKMSMVNITGYNKIPPIVILSLIQLNKIDEKVITPIELRTIDTDTLPQDIIYTLIKSPEKGILILFKRTLFRSDTFTQQDINDKQVRYKYQGPSVTYAKDYFLIKLFDGSFETNSKQVFIFLTQPIQIPKMSIFIQSIKVYIGRKFVLDKSLFVIKNAINDVVQSLIITVKSKLTCGAFYYYTNLDYPVVKFTYDDIKQRRIFFFISECPEVVKHINILVSMFSYKNFEQGWNINIEIVPRINAVPILKKNETIVALIGSNLILKKDMLSVIDEDTPSDKIIYKYLNNNQTFQQLLINKQITNTFTQFDINTEKVEIRIDDDFNETQSNLTLQVSDGENEGYIYNTYYQVSGTIIIPIIFSNWKHNDLILLKFSVPNFMKFVDGYSAFKWSYDQLLVSRPDAKIKIAKDLVAGFFYNIKTKQSVTSFNQTDINRGNIFYLLYKEKSAKIYKEIFQFTIFYQSFKLSSEILEMQWSIIEFDKIKYKLCPQRGLLTITVIRIGNLNLESLALVGFQSMEAIMNQDFRLMSPRLLVFARGESKKFVSIKILITGSLMKENKFQVILKSPKQAVFGQKSQAIVSIKNRKTCGNKEYFMMEKSRKVQSKTESPLLKNMLQDFGHPIGDYTTDNRDQDLPSSDELEIQYRNYLYKDKGKIKCKKGWISYGKRCYRSFRSKLTWSIARKHCQKYDSYLTSVTSDAFQSWLSKLFSSPRPYWIGLFREENDFPRWKYPNNEAVLYKRWHKGFPKMKGNKKKNCALVTKKNRWKNRPCEKKTNSFICMKNPEVLI